MACARGREVGGGRAHDAGDALEMRVRRSGPHQSPSRVLPQANRCIQPRRRQWRWRRLLLAMPPCTEIGSCFSGVTTAIWAYGCRRRQPSPLVGLLGDRHALQFHRNHSQPCPDETECNTNRCGKPCSSTNAYGPPRRRSKRQGFRAGGFGFGRLARPPEHWPVMFRRSNPHLIK